MTGTWGGAERYALSVASAMSESVRTRLVVFGPKLARYRLGQLEICMLPTRLHWKDGTVNPLSEQIALYATRTRVIHAHQYQSVLTNVLLILGAALRKKVFVTDHGGASYNYADRFQLERFVSGFLPVSRFSAGFFPQLQARMSEPLLGGADLRRFHPGSGARLRRVVYVGRLLPHKGIDTLIRAMDRDTPLLIFGRAYDAEYLQILEGLARGKAVTFNKNADDSAVADALRTSRVAVLPSVYDASDGSHNPWSELLGLALIEAMASGTPVVASRVGGMPEIVEDGHNGFLVTPGEPAELWDRITQVLDASEWQQLSENALALTHDRLNWPRVAEICLRSYERSPRARLRS
jgi:glycosyltransferase involved in cell wall biosynthesis